jgi:hypothetical protein
MHAAWQRFGTLPWATLIAPAVTLAAAHLIDSSRVAGIAGDSTRLSSFPASASQFLPDGHAPARGTLFRQPDLARTLRLIADSGPDVFYRGQIADLIVAEMGRGHGLISTTDLAAYQAKWRTPVRIGYRGYTVLSMPPASSGGVTMGEILNILEGYDSLPPFGSTALLHLEAEAMRAPSRIGTAGSAIPISCRCRSTVCCRRPTPPSGAGRSIRRAPPRRSPPAQQGITPRITPSWTPRGTPWPSRRPSTAASGAASPYRAPGFS